MAGLALVAPPRDYAAFAKRERIEPNIAEADFDDDGMRDVAVLLLTSSTRTAQPRLAVCLTRGSGVELGEMEPATRLERVTC